MALVGHTRCHFKSELQEPALFSSRPSCTHNHIGMGLVRLFKVEESSFENNRRLENMRMNEKLVAHIKIPPRKDLQVHNPEKKPHAQKVSRVVAFPIWSGSEFQTKEQKSGLKEEIATWCFTPSQPRRVRGPISTKHNVFLPQANILIHYSIHIPPLRVEEI